MTPGGRRRARSIACAALAWAGLAVFSFGGVLTRVSAVSTAAGLELRIFASGFFDSRIFLLDHPNRVILDISGIGESTAAPTTSVNEAGVRSVRTSLFTADVARIVIDVEGEVPTYKLSRVADGFLIFFPRALAAAPPVLEIVKPGPEGKTAVPAKAAPAERPPDESASGIPIPGKKSEAPPAPVPSPIRIVDGAFPALPASRRENSFRVTAAVDLFLFRDEVLAAAYGKAANFGGRLDVRLFDFGGLWLGADYYRRSAAAGGTRTVRLVPIEAGIKFIMSRGVLAPYVGFGAAYFFFHEEAPSGTLSLAAFGLTSTAGILLRLGPSFTFDGYARYRYLPVDLAVRAFDAGGFHFGAGIGWAF